ncbi:MBL fold metallo-hydrolase [Ectothiorhodospiraceae bacterium 2226]|nr:MBL fold metallo-hydrolase [Ectothiorhodospiraceae bacterium 2226]
MRAWLLGSMGVLVLGAVALVVLATPAAPGDYAMQPVEVGPGVYAVPSAARDLPNPENKGWNANLAFVVTGDGVLVVDTGSSETIGRALREAVAGVTDQPVRWIVNTHAHGDHWLGNAAFETDAAVIASTPVRARIEQEAERWITLFDTMTEGATGASRVRLPDTLVDEHRVFDMGGTRVELIPSGDSHSEGDLVVWLPEARALITGDVLYSDRAPSLWDGDARQWSAFLGELIALEPAVVIPGHGSVSDVQGLKRLQAFIDQMWEVVAEGVDQGLADFEVVPVASERLAAFRPHYAGYDEKMSRSVAAVYAQVEQSLFAD